MLEWADIDAQYRKFNKLKPEDVARLEEWQRMQPHLPPPLHTIETIIFLQNCHYSIEQAKQRIEAFFTFRTHCPEFFAHRDPFGSEIQLALKTWLIAVLPELTPDGCAVNYIRLQDYNLNAYHFNSQIKVTDMTLNLIHRQRGCHNGHVFIIDLEGCTMGHILKWNLLSLKKGLIFLQTAVPVDFKAFHFVNAVPFMDMFFAVLRPFLNKEFRDMLHAHYGDNSSIFKYVPKSMLPIECGGSKFDATDYYTNVIRKEIERNAEFFKCEEKQLVDESKRLGKPTNLDDLFGVEGTFKKLNVD